MENDIEALQERLAELEKRAVADRTRIEHLEGQFLALAALAFARADSVHIRPRDERDAICRDWEVRCATHQLNTLFGQLPADPTTAMAEAMQQIHDEFSHTLQPSG